LKDAYRTLCDVETSIPLFSQAWWLDAVAGNNWDVALVEKGGEIVASMPYVIKQRYGLTFISQPPLTQTQGPWFRQTNAKYAKRLSREKDFMGALIDQLPKYDHFAQNWDHLQTNWLPFYWKGFSQTTCYTYRIEQLGNSDEIWAGFQQSIRTDIKKAANRENLTVRDDLPLSDFYALNTMVFQRQGKRVPYSEAFVEELDQAAAARGCRKVFIAEDDQGRHHAGVYLVWDRNSAYYLMGGRNPELRNSGATSLCMWEAIKFASTVTGAFDLEGSMLEPVERFFRSFGAVQTPYHNIRHTPSRVLQAASTLRSLLR
jgi:hypothetical protein